jgi:hypothetical protein
MPELIDYVSSLVMGLLLLWGARKNHLKLPLTIVAVLTLVEPVIIPVAFFRASILPRSQIFLVFSALSLVITITLIWGAWTNHLKRSLLLVGLLVIVRQLIISAYSFHSIISSVVYNPIPLAIGIALIWVAWTDRLKWALMIWGAVMTIMSLVALVPALILLILYWSTSK